MGGSLYFRMCSKLAEVTLTYSVFLFAVMTFRVSSASAIWFYLSVGDGSILR